MIAKMEKSWGSSLEIISAGRCFRTHASGRNWYLAGSVLARHRLSCITSCARCRLRLLSCTKRCCRFCKRRLSLRQGCEMRLHCLLLLTPGRLLFSPIILIWKPSLDTQRSSHWSVRGRKCLSRSGSSREGTSYATCFSRREHQVFQKR